ncbi:uncharacterized protein DUF4402 [Desulfobotulus alkaliphilus]|uniref:Uncharacterized protein DUF4402 n=1 Tax=Desulfobotulus alkaliphilus TaxID=622671 RepID=A0A562S6C3_9BACT|nr:DUF4402 domain-containing protein [Desulfobotulus alkaliphilus]TWI76872.1 uncharacterized protein DUF4402 [Desulfobotulus alkaliphilus]
MKKKWIVFAAALAWILLPCMAYSDPSEASVDVEVKASVVPFSLGAVKDPLDFGEIIPGGEEFTIRINARNGTSTDSSDRVTTAIFNSSKGYVSGVESGLITVNTNSVGAYEIDYGGAITLALLTDPTTTMALSQIEENSTLEADIVFPDNDDPFYIHIGGLLTVAANQEPGDYEGTVTVTISRP